MLTCDKSSQQSHKCGVNPVSKFLSHSGEHSSPQTCRCRCYSYHRTVYECVGRSVRSPTHGLPRGTSGEEPACRCRRRGFSLWVRKIPWSRKWQPTAVLLSAESHGQRSLAGCSPGGHRESDTAERLNSHTAQAWSQRLSVMVDVRHPRAWATRFPDVCSNSMPGVSARVFFF